MPGDAVWISEGTGGTVAAVPGQLAKAASSFWIMAARVNEPETAAIMLAGCTYFRWKSTRSARVMDWIEAAVVKRLLKWPSP
jgi:hypothetical protein